MKLSTLFESPVVYYHGSPQKLTLRVPLTARSLDSSAFRAQSPLTAALEVRKPQNQPSRMQCWFLCDTVEQVRSSTGSTKFIYQVTAETPVFKHYYGWLSLAQSHVHAKAFDIYMNQNPGDSVPLISRQIYTAGTDPLLIQYFDNYWNGVELTEQDINSGSKILPGLRLIEYTTETITVVSKV